MTCIHGLDEISCPTCRILKSTTPIKELTPNSKDILKIKHPFLKNNSNLDKKLVNEITVKKVNLISPNFISKPRFINDIPNFKNELFLKRVKELDLSKEDTHGITKKVPLENPKWEFKEE